MRPPSAAARSQRGGSLPRSTLSASCKGRCASPAAMGLRPTLDRTSPVCYVPIMGARGLCGARRGSLCPAAGIAPPAPSGGASLGVMWWLRTARPPRTRCGFRDYSRAGRFPPGRAFILAVVAAPVRALCAYKILRFAQSRRCGGWSRLGGATTQNGNFVLSKLKKASRGRICILPRDFAFNEW